jgi:precorrin-6Y C5,15-methyltransferase (decarboxylating)
MTQPILIVGLSAAGANGLPSALVERIVSADLLVGGQRQLGYFPEFAGETMPVTTEVEPIAARLQQTLNAGERAVVLASGDPLCYGLGASLWRYLPAEALEIIPAPTAFQLAFAALVEPWAEAALLSAHARPLDDVVAGVLDAPKAAILTDSHHTPGLIARTLLQAGLSPQSACAICENLGGSDQRIVRTTLGEVDRERYAALNVFVVWRDQTETGRIQSTAGQRLAPVPPGLPVEAFSTSAGQITKREVRLLSLAELALRPGDVMWDIGAGSGSISIEAARAQPLAIVYAIDKRAGMIVHLAENVRRFPAPNLKWFEGLAPDAIADWPAPDAVFIGGSSGRLGTLIELARQRLRPDGRLVINLATLENLHLARSQLPEAQIIQVQISRGIPIMDMLRFEAQNPVFILSWQKGA